MISTAIEMVHLKVACGIRPALGSLHNMTNIPGGALCDGFLAGRTHAILPSTQTLRDKRVLLDRITAFLLEHELLDHAALVSLGTGVALAFGIINSMWLESRSDFISDL